jgi:ribosomal protein S18 acetylase RimI-like enzyme
LWIAPGPEAVGLATWRGAFPAGRRVHLFLAPGYRHLRALAALLEAVERFEPNSPVIGVSDLLPGFAEGERVSFFRSRGFYRVSRIDLRYPESRPLPSAPSGPAPPLLPLSTADGRRLAELLTAAYADMWAERALFVRELDAVQDARTDVQGILGDEVGEWLPWASFGIEEGGRLAAAVLVNCFHGPLITELLVHPSHRRRGFGRRLLVRALAALRDHRAGEPRLVVTRQNERAFRLYRGMGWEPIPGTEGAMWLNLSRLGWPTPPDPSAFTA